MRRMIVKGSPESNRPAAAAGAARLRLPAAQARYTTGRDGDAHRNVNTPEHGEASNVAPAGVALLALALAAAAIHGLIANPDLVAWRVIALAVGLGLGMWRLRYGIFACVCLVPLLGMLPRSVGISDLSLPEHLVIPLILCGALRLLWRRTRRRRSAIDGWLAVFLAVVALSTARALWEYSVAGRPLWEIVWLPLARHFSFTIWDAANGPFLVVHYTLVAVEGALWFALLTAPGTGVRAAALRGALVLGAAGVALVGVAQSIWRFQMVAFFTQVQPDLVRINATLPDPNTLGSFLVLLLPIGLIVALERPGGGWLAAIWSVVAVYCLVRSVSRTAWVSVAVVAVAATAVAGWWPSLLGLQLSAVTTRRLRRVLAAVLVSAGLAVTTISVGGVAHVGYRDARSPLDMLVFTLDARRRVDDLLPARSDHWRAAVDIWRDFPLLGAGTGKYVLLKSRYLPEARARWMAFTEPHNYYLKLLCELGVVGLAAFLGVLGSIGAQARRAWSAADRAGRRRVAAVVAATIGFLLCLLAQDPLTLREMQYVFWTVVALLVLEARERA
jgi:O-antigen ligase